MSVTVADLLQLPSLRGARLAAGEGALKKLVSSISVLEFANPNWLQDSLFRNNEFFGSEIVITGFANIPLDVEAQCANIQRLAAAGEVGLILYYVGIFVPTVDRRLVELADRLDFALIVMPENRMDLRYSDVICDVMGAIFKDQNNSALMVSDILGRAALLPEHQRTVDTVLKLLSDRIRASVVLTDGALRLLNAVSWPRMDVAQQLDQMLHGLDTLPENGGPPLEVTLDGCKHYVYRATLSSGAPLMELFIVKEGTPLALDVMHHAAEVVHLASCIWSQNHDRVVMSELVRAILRDEPIKMRRLAELLHVNIGAIHSMWVLQRGSGDPQTFQAGGLDLIQRLLRHRSGDVVADCYEGDVVVFLAWNGSAEEMHDLAEACCDRVQQAGLDGYLTICQSLVTTSDVRRAYLTIHTAQEAARQIWPGRRWFTGQEMEFTCACRELIDQSEAEIARRLSVLAPLREGTETDLVGTLSTYYLDAASSIPDTAAHLFMHKNTVKYRLQQAERRLGHPVDKLPEAIALYKACALNRLLSS